MSATHGFPRPCDLGRSHELKTVVRRTIRARLTWQRWEHLYHRRRGRTVARRFRNAVKNGEHRFANPEVRTSPELRKVDVSG